MADVQEKEKATGDHNPLPDQGETDAASKDAAVNSSSTVNNAKPSTKKLKKSPNSRRILALSKLVGVHKAKATNGKGKGIPYTKCKEPDTFQYLDNNQKELYSLLYMWYSKVQDLKKGRTWNDVLVEDYAKHFPEEPKIELKNGQNSISKRYSNYKKWMDAIVEIEEEAAALAEATENPEFVFPDEDEDEDDIESDESLESDEGGYEDED
ncbi:hypothetical protein NHQ30_007020 [Ciborinia camelliae]|nr:hypothetical protein NHQ30_007020 [Ciborinia camelliae]